MPEKRRTKNLRSAKHHATRKTKPAAKKTVTSKVKKAAKATRSPKADKAPKGDQLSVYDLKAKEIGSVALDPMFAGKTVNTDIVYQAVVMYRAGEREGTACTKERGAVRGGGKKPWKQKGTGQARHGSRRSPIWRGGGTTFGPEPRDYSYSIPAKLRKQAVIETFKDKVLKSKVFLVKKIALSAPKTREVAGILGAFKMEKPLFVVEKKENDLVLASRNIPTVSLKTHQDVNGLDLVSHKECLMTEGAYAGLIARLRS